MNDQFDGKSNIFSVKKMFKVLFFFANKCTVLTACGNDVSTNRYAENHDQFFIFRA